VDGSDDIMARDKLALPLLPYELQQVGIEPRLEFVEEIYLPSDLFWVSPFFFLVGKKSYSSQQQMARGQSKKNEARKIQESVKVLK
jgi:hypothetical protein